MESLKLRLFSALILGISLIYSSACFSDATPQARALLQKFAKIRAAQSEIAPGLPIYIQTQKQNKTLIVETIGRIDYPFSDVSTVLSRYQSFCEFLPLLFNSKACITRKDGPVIHIKHFVAGKQYTHPMASIRIHSVYKLLENKNDFVSLIMTPDPAKSGSTDYRVSIKAVPFGDSSLLLIQSIYIPGPVTRAATKTYVKLFARNKPGFTIVGKKKNGKPKYIGGFPAVIERSVVRSYLALKAYLQTHKLPKGKQFESRIAAWYKLNSPHKFQLHELEKSEYFRIQRRERINQIRYQEKYSKPGKIRN